MQLKITVSMLPLVAMCTCVEMMTSTSDSFVNGIRIPRFPFNIVGGSRISAPIILYKVIMVCSASHVCMDAQLCDTSMILIKIMDRATIIYPMLFYFDFI